MDIDLCALNAEILHEVAGNLNIFLYTVRHQHTEYPLPAQCLHTESSHNGRILSAGDPDYRRRFRSVFQEPAADPFHTVGSNLLIVVLRQIIL